MRIVADTNTVVSGLLWSGPPQQIIQAARTGRVELYSSLPLVAEFAEVIGRAQFATRIRAAALSSAQLVADLSRIAKLVVPAEISPTLTHDPDDDQVLACALAAGAELTVSGDKALRNLKTYHRIPIVDSSEALRRIEQAP